ncbi:hypothetical protein XTGART2_0734 [Xanthomonas translucens pv. graminis]|jgi:hypothetical protein|uniref:Uncharacterized protein n=1 Tax=Xanthomonas graminis pv. graminis TaxID=134874 RepID=A0A1M4IDB8_9XANT|nr:hypothetical protein XTG29_00498 [Xanthomonas translucens pv. graminis ART-Xtg29]SBV39818.1 hypothetical protein XTGART2_0734 [Xanthomonas translucens pv. graminis]SBV40070.1 hypothetical protein XTGART9_0748 [Xanthomonas translucens pv. graminis]SBV46139.1 hypothetical protein XTGART29_0765 [Xanthomonas translucens pv. graminis ART-Xtg29]SBV54136.1 hypothetical protein XTGART10_0747 [Xanthomonas translucens pv. graminis]
MAVAAVAAQAQGGGGRDGRYADVPQLPLERATPAPRRPERHGMRSGSACRQARPLRGGLRPRAGRKRETVGASRLRQPAPWLPVQVSRRVTLRLNTGVAALWS